MHEVLYALFAISVFCPVYTYVLYPLILKCLPEKNYKFDCCKQTITVTVIVAGKNGKKKAEKIRQTFLVDTSSNIGSTYFSVLDILYTEQISETTNKLAKGEIIVFTDDKTELDKEAISEIIKMFADKRIGCVVGQQTNPDGNSTFWKYENAVKRLESKIGCVSGATASLFAVRKIDLPIISDCVLNKPFYIATAITQAGKDVVYQPSAKAYEGRTEGTNFDKHVQDAAGYWQALHLFPKMLLPINKGNFVYISHRVMKWLVWLNMLMMLVISGMLAKQSFFMAFLLFLQLIGYGILIVHGNKSFNCLFGRLLNFGYDFFSLNLAYFFGMFRYRSDK